MVDNFKSRFTSLTRCILGSLSDGLSVSSTKLEEVEKNRITSSCNHSTNQEDASLALSALFITIDPFSTTQVILVSAQCSKSGIIDPVDFIVSEGEDMGILKYLSRGEVDQAKLGELITQHNKILKHAMQCKTCSRSAWSMMRF